MSDQVVEKEFELDEASIQAIAKNVEINEDSIAEKIAAKMIEAHEKANDQPVNKKVNAGATDVTAETIEKMTPQERTRAHLKALRAGDQETVAKYNQHSVDTLVKAGYMNVTVTADGGGFVPDADLLNEVFSLEANYGVAARLCRVVNVNSDSVKAAALTSTVEFTEVTTETGVKSTTKPVFAYPSVELREFAAIIVMTDQLLEDAAFDVRGFVAAELAKAAGKKEDQLLFTDATTGLLNIAGVVDVASGGPIADVSFDDLITAQYAVPAASSDGGTFVVGRALIPVLRRAKDTNGAYVWQPGTQAGVPGSIIGQPYVVSEVFGTGTAAGAVAVYGNFGQYAVLIRKAGLKLTFHDSGTVNVGGTDYNLIQQDMTAMRAVIRRNVFIPVPGAFSRITVTATV